MGFGTLFFGYFLLLDVAYEFITDVIAASIMAYALSKLSGINRGFKAALYASLVFLAFSAVEFGFGAYDMLFAPPDNPTLTTAFAIIRNVILCILTLTMLEGMREVAAEVGLTTLSKKCKISAYATLPVYVLAIITETPALLSWATPYVAAVIGVSSLLITLVFVIINLVSIHDCYSKICMPGDEDREKSRKNKKGSGESFIDAYKRQRDERREASKARTAQSKSTDDKRN